MATFSLQWQRVVATEIFLDMSIPKPISLASEIKLSDWTSMSHVTTQNHRN